jgi:hypothetical protein
VAFVPRPDRKGRGLFATQIQLATGDADETF